MKIKTNGRDAASSIQTTTSPRAAPNAADVNRPTMNIAIPKGNTTKR